MEGADVGDDRTFKVSLPREGAARLRERVKEKLKEYMGDYTDDTLVEYIFVLLTHGRRKDEARRELNVFLGDDSVSFVSWLWDHLSSKLHLYMQPKENYKDEMDKAKFTSNELTINTTKSEKLNPSENVDHDFEQGKTSKISGSRGGRAWRGVVQQENESFSFRSTLSQNVLSRDTKDSSSTKAITNRKRTREEEEPPLKTREMVSMSKIDAPRRLLQFAVRDAVRTAQQSSARTEGGFKRLQSVVLTSTSDSVPETRPPKIRSIARVPGAFATALKAAVEAAEDITRSKYSGSVFDRLGHGSEATGRIETEQLLPENKEYECLDQVSNDDRRDLHVKSRHNVKATRDTDMLECVNELETDSSSENDEYDVGIGHQGSNVSQNVPSAIRDKNSLMVQCSVAQDPNVVGRKTRHTNHDLPTIYSPKGSSKIVNISVNVNTWKPPNYESREPIAGESRAANDKNEATTMKPSSQLAKENRTLKVEKQNNSVLKDASMEPQKTVATVPGSYPISRPSSEDVDSRTVFVSNVHFGATKDALSRHFNKFGEVLKVIIITDAATGQPKGSAYIEFLRKESAELALSLNGSSFMSRILKVVRRTSAHPEAASTLGWPRIARPTPFAARFAYPRGTLSRATLRPRVPLKIGARSLQWKREDSGPRNSPSLQGNNLLSPKGRNLTYVRPEAKAAARPGGA